MATKTFIVTVPAGIGGGFYIDGVQKPTLDLAIGATYRFDQSDASNNFHPINFSATSNGTHGGGTKYTTDVTEVGTPGSSGAYTEITLSFSTPNPLYYYCQNHSGMGGQLDLNANSWGAISWGEGNWGDQPDVTAIATGLNNSIALNSVDSFPNQGWGSDFWGVENWGESGNTVTLTGFNLSIGSDAPQVAIGQQVDVSGEQLNIQNLGDPLVFSATEVFLDQNPLTGLTVEAGSLADRTDVFPIGIQLNADSGTVDAYNEQGWGRDAWNSQVWGASGFWGIVETTGIQLTANLGTVDAKAVTIAEPSGIGLTSAEGTVDPSPDATVTGIGMTVGVGLGTVFGIADVDVTGIELTVDLGTAVLDAVTFAEVTGQQLNTALNSVVSGASAEAPLTGNALTVGLRSINVQSWQIVDTGTSVNWNDIDTAA